MIYQKVYSYLRYPFSSSKRNIYFNRNFHNISKDLFDKTYCAKIFFIKIFIWNLKGVRKAYNDKYIEIFESRKKIDLSKDSIYEILPCFLNHKELKNFNLFYYANKNRSQKLDNFEIANTIIFYNNYDFPIYFRPTNTNLTLDQLRKFVFFSVAFEKIDLKNFYIHIANNLNIKYLLYKEELKYDNGGIKSVTVECKSKQELHENLEYLLKKGNVFSNLRINIFWINLTSQNERKKHMENFFNALGVDSKRISAVNGMKLLKRLNLNLIESPSEIGCLLSHIKVIKYFLRNNHDKNEYCLIMEDDISLDNQYFTEETILKIVAEAPVDWEILVLGYSNRRKLFRRYEPWDGALSGAFSYLIKHSAAEKLIDKFSYSKMLEERSEKKFVSDIYLYKNLKTYFYCNKIFITEDFQSTISETHYDSHLASRSIEFNHD